MMKPCIASVVTLLMLAAAPAHAADAATSGKVKAKASQTVTRAGSQASIINLTLSGT